jgi:hypothetical protein
MSYARLTFSTSNPPAGQVLKVLAQVLTGESNIANLGNVGTFYTTSAGVTTSEIVGNTAADSWTLVYPTSLPDSGNNQVSTFTISSPCVTAGKTKYVRFIGATSAGVFFEPAYGNGTVFSSTVSYSLYAQGLSSIDASGNCANLTWRNSNGTQATVIKGTSTVEQYTIEMSWSKRHLLVTSSLGNNCYFAAFEFPETVLTTAYGNAVPVIYTTGPATSTLTSVTANSTALAHVHNVVNLYNPVTAAWVGVRALTPASAHTARIQSSTVYGYGPNRLITYSEDSSPVGTFTITPIVHDDIGFGNGYLDLSVYSNIYIAPSDSEVYGTMYQGSNGVTYKGIEVYDNARTTLTMFMVKYG